MAGRNFRGATWPTAFRVWLEDGRSWKRHVNHIRVNIPTEPVVRGSEVSRQPLGSREQRVTRHSTSVGQLPAPYRDSSPSTTSIPEPRREHVFRNAKKRKEGTMLRIKPKDSTSA